MVSVSISGTLCVLSVDELSLVLFVRGAFHELNSIVGFVALQ